MSVQSWMAQSAREYHDEAEDIILRYERCLSQLREAYVPICAMRKELANGLVAPAIRELEKLHREIAPIVRSFYS